MDYNDSQINYKIRTYLFLWILISREWFQHQRRQIRLGKEGRETQWCCFCRRWVKTGRMSPRLQVISRISHDSISMVGGWAEATGLLEKYPALLLTNFFSGIMDGHDDINGVNVSLCGPVFRKRHTKVRVER